MLNRKKSKLFLEMFNYAKKQIVHILLPENSKTVNMVACNNQIYFKQVNGSS